MILTLVAISLLAFASDDTSKHESEVRGVIATRVEFRSAGKAKMIEACLDLLLSCRYSHHPNEGPMPDWDEKVLEIREGKQAYLHIKLSEPRILKMVTDEKVTVSEMLVIFPLSSGGLFVRDGRWAKGYGKYEYDFTVRVQEQMKYALPAG